MNAESFRKVRVVSHVPLKDLVIELLLFLFGQVYRKRDKEKKERDANKLDLHGAVRAFGADIACGDLHLADHRKCRACEKIELVPCERKKVKEQGIEDHAGEASIITESMDIEVSSCLAPIRGDMTAIAEAPQMESPDASSTMMLRFR
jgi:hypothetical protein